MLDPGLRRDDKRAHLLIGIGVIILLRQFDLTTKKGCVMKIRNNIVFSLPVAAMIAVADRCGGLRAATRVNLFVGVLVALCFAGMMSALYRSWSGVRAFPG